MEPRIMTRICARPREELYSTLFEHEELIMRTGTFTVADFSVCTFNNFSLIFHRPFLPRASLGDIRVKNQWCTDKKGFSEETRTSIQIQQPAIQEQFPEFFGCNPSSLEEDA